MASIITNEFRLENLKAFKAALADTVNNSFYLFIGRISEWTNEAVPPTPVDSGEMIRDTHDELLAGKKVTDTNVRQGIYLRPWTTGEFYDMYRHDYDGSVTGTSLVGAATTPDHLFEANYYVIDPTSLRVYKCLYNRSHTTNAIVASTVMPTTTATAPQATADGYVWKYMFEVQSGDAADYNTPSFVPAPTTDVDSVSGADGGIYACVITNVGSGYSTDPTVVIEGDGTGATATVVRTTNTVTYITMTNVGSGYTHATISFTGGGGTNAAAKAILSPAGGHATAPADELGGIYMIVARKLIGDEGGDFTVENSPRQLGLLKNPTLSAVLVTSNTVQFCRELVFQNPITGGPFTANEIIDGATSLAQGRVVDYDAGTRVLRYVLLVNGDNERPEFVDSEVVTGADSSASGTTLVSGGALMGETDEYTGKIIYFENRRAIARDAAQTEDYRLVVEF